MQNRFTKVFDFSKKRYMLTITVHRIEYREEYTRGKMYLNGRYFCDTLEDRVRYIWAGSCDNKKDGITAIPAGKYSVRYAKSDAFTTARNKGKKEEDKKDTYLGRLNLTKKVDCFDGILIHAGNSTDDTYGCILVGKYDGSGKLKGGSRGYEDLLGEILSQQKDGMEIIIRDVFFPIAAENYVVFGARPRFIIFSYCPSCSFRDLLLEYGDYSSSEFLKNYRCDTCPVRLLVSPLSYDALEDVDYPPLYPGTIALKYNSTKVKWKDKIGEDSYIICAEQPKIPSRT